MEKQQMTDEKKILVYYVGIGSIDEQDVEEYVNRIAKKITPTTFEGEIIIIPVRSYNTEIKCINPVYVTEEALIEEHNELIKELNKELQTQLGILNNEKNEE